MKFYINVLFLLPLFLSTSFSIHAQLDLDFSHTRGYYNSTFQLTVTCEDPNATIRYTTNSTAPSATNGTTYSGPISISSNTTLRVYVYNAAGDSKTKTHTYLFPNEVKNESYMGTFITNDPTLGPQFEAGLLDIPTISVVTPNTINDTNPLAGSFEFFFAKKDLSSHEDCGIKLFGATSTTAPKNSHRVYFRSEFGSTSFKEKIYADVNNGSKAVTSFDQLELRADNQESFQNNFEDTRTYIGPRFLDNTMIAMGHVHSQGRYVHFFKNGEYRGQYYLRERMNDNFMEDYFGGVEEDYETIDGSGFGNLGGTWTPGTPIDGSGSMWNTMVAASNNFDTWKEYINEQNYFDFMLTWMWGNHENEMKAAGNHDEPTEFIFRINDGEGVFTYYDAYLGVTNIDRTDPNASGSHNAAGHDNIFRNLYNQGDSDFRTAFADRVECQCFNDGALTPQKMIDRIDTIVAEISLSMIPEAARWGTQSEGEYPSAAFNQINQAKQNYIPYRTDILINQLKNRSLYPSNNNAVQFGDLGGVFPTGYQLTLTNPNNSDYEVYYTLDGTDPRLPDGALNPNAILYTGATTLPSGVHKVIARSRHKTRTNTSRNKWSAMCPRTFYIDVAYQDIVINEIMYNPDSLCSATDSTELDFIELHNIGANPIDLADCEFTKGITYKFPYPSVIQPGGFLVLAEDITEFQTVYGFTPTGQYRGSLSNSGENITITNSIDVVIDSVNYNDRNPWDEDPDGNGPSLELLDPFSDNNDPTNWFRSDNSCGTPAANNSRVCTGVADQIVINEINYNSNNGITDPGDWVELHNPTANAIDISDWTFYDNNNEYIIPSGTSIAAGEFLVLVENTTMFTSIFPHLNASQYLGDFVFGLSNKGERVSLFDENKCLSDYVVYNDRIPWDTIPDGNGPTLSLITPNSDNTLPQSWEGSSNINSAYGTPGRANVPCLQQQIIIPDTVYANTDTLLTVDVLDPNVTCTWLVPGGVSSNSNSDSTMVRWATPGTYTVQLISNYFECTKVYNKQVVVVPACIDIQLYTWLEGTYDDAIGEMTTSLNTVRGLLPGQTPVSGLAIPTPAGQPYSAAPWNYAGTEGTGWTDADYTGDEVDWVLVSMRTGIAKGTEVVRSAGLLNKDGSIRFPDRCALLSTVADSLYIVVEHRNHIGVMSPAAIDIINNELYYDFRMSDSYRDPTSFGQKQSPTGEWTMYAGDADQSDFPSFDIKGTDKTLWFQNNGVFDYYLSPDFNLDGDINGQDKSLWFENNGISSRVPK